jgi:hypothetical protein
MDLESALLSFVDAIERRKGTVLHLFGQDGKPVRMRFTTTLSYMTDNWGRRTPIELPAMLGVDPRHEGPIRRTAGVTWCAGIVDLDEMECIEHPSGSSRLYSPKGSPPDAPFDVLVLRIVEPPPW